ncbi:calcium-activated potassium channel subunit alpha-1-like [Convolutriloba macropyga]|uniref:calcium-activated potassium channel subunit alpha-1-like n=1 Tax=Convolutriloba macropyga TaxID=536237 RepID=UPI003F520BDC
MTQETCCCSPSVVTQAPNVNQVLEDECNDEKFWYAFISSSVITFATGLFVILACRAHVMFKKDEEDNDDETDNEHRDSPGGGPPGEEEEKAEVGWLTSLKDWAGILISAQTTTGRILMVFMAFNSLAAFVIYLLYTGSE